MVGLVMVEQKFGGEKELAGAVVYCPGTCVLLFLYLHIEGQIA